jgi:hypothetical protein
MDVASTVAIVVDPDFAGRLAGIVPRMPVWVARTAGNSDAIQELFRRFGRGEPGALTSFAVDPGASREDWCASILDTVDEHHGAASQDPPVRSIEVIGTPLSPALRGICEELGFRSFRDTAAGFVASRPG